MKKSFILYNDSLEIFDELTDTQAGKLFKAIIQFEVTGELVELDPILKMAFIPFRNQLVRNREAYDVKVEKNRTKALERERKRRLSRPPDVTTGQEGHSTDKDKDKDKDNGTIRNDNETVNGKETVKETKTDNVSDTVKEAKRIFGEKQKCLNHSNQ